MDKATLTLSARSRTGRRNAVSLLEQLGWMDPEARAVSFLAGRGVRVTVDACDVGAIRMLAKDHKVSVA